MFPFLNDTVVKTCEIGLCNEQILITANKVCSAISTKFPIIFIGFGFLLMMIHDFQTKECYDKEDNLKSIIYWSSYIGRYLFLFVALYLLYMKTDYFMVQ